MHYYLFYTGLASTPNTVGIMCLTTNEVGHQVNVSMPSGRETRDKYYKFVNILKTKYSSILN